MAIDVAPLSSCKGMQRSDAYQDDDDRKKHMAFIQAIAEAEQLPLEEVAACYEYILQDMRRTAIVCDFLDVLVTKRVRNRLRNGSY